MTVRFDNQKNIKIVQKPHIFVLNILVLNSWTVNNKCILIQMSRSTIRMTTPAALVFLNPPAQTMHSAFHWKSPWPLTLGLHIPLHMLALCFQQLLAAYAWGQCTYMPHIPNLPYCVCGERACTPDVTIAPCKGKVTTIKKPACSQIFIFYI